MDCYDRCPLYGINIKCCSAFGRVAFVEVAREPSLFALVEMAQPAQAKNVAPHYAAPYFEMQR
jgi:hypothetical protein